MSKCLGNFILHSYDLFNAFHYGEVFNDDDQAAEDTYEKNNLNDPDFIIGYSDGTEKSINNSLPNFTPFEIEVEGKTGILTGKYKDSGIATSAYQVKIILLAEEYPEDLNSTKS
jgi:hypothetical protein